MLIGYLLVTVLCEGPVLLGRLSADVRRDLFGSLAATSGALLGFIVTALSILVALPRGAAVERLRKFDAWRLLTRALLTAAALLLATLVLSTLALAIDDDARGNQWLEIALATLTSAALAVLVVGGTAFGMVISEAASEEG